MEKEARLQAIYDTISNSEVPVSGSALSKKFNVSRQVIVQDIALLKARNVHIYATHKGYVCSPQRVRRVFSCYHLNDRMEEEMNAIVDCGGCIENVFVKHNVYGKLEAKMNISSRKQVKEFIDSISQNQAKPLTDLTSGYHCHTVSAQSKEDLDSIEESLRKLHILQEA